MKIKFAPGISLNISIQRKRSSKKNDTKKISFKSKLLNGLKTISYKTGMVALELLIRGSKKLLNGMYYFDAGVGFVNLYRVLSVGRVSLMFRANTFTAASVTSSIVLSLINSVYKRITGHYSKKILLINSFLSFATRIAAIFIMKAWITSAVVSLFSGVLIEFIIGAAILIALATWIAVGAADVINASLDNIEKPEPAKITDEEIRDALFNAFDNGSARTSEA